MSLPDFFLRSVVAEIRQQMDGVLALTERLDRQRLAPDAQACVAGVTETAKAVNRLLESALDLRAAAFETIALEPEPVRLRELVDEVQERWRARALGPGVTLLVSYDGDPEAVVMADRARLLQVFDGLIGEAVGAQSRGAVEASLRAAPATGAVRLEGRVRGPRDAAAPAQDLETRIRGIAARLGLEAALNAMIARRLVERMGGDVRSEGHAGASETVAFSLTAPSAVDPPQAPAAAARAAHVLVVDDNATNRMVAQSMVEMFDCTSEAAEDGLQALEAVRSGRFDLILMDIRMPKMDGVAATRAIRALPAPAGATPIIALTANADPEDAADYLAAGMNGVVEKPMKAEHLLVALDRALGDDTGAVATEDA